SSGLVSRALFACMVWRAFTEIGGKSRARGVSGAIYRLDNQERRLPLVSVCCSVTLTESVDLPTARSWVDVAPSAARLTRSLRDIGYDFPTAVADLVDNSISA